MEVGIDCVDIDRFDESSQLMKHNINRIFTDNEIKYCQSKEFSSQHFAVRFAGKEAVKKALSSFHIDLAFHQIEIINDSDGKPFVSIDDDRSKNFFIKISLSHSNTSAVAIALISKK